MKILAATGTILLCCANIINAANILALLSTVSPSHHIWNSPLLEALAKRGHNVTVLSPQARLKPITNLTDLVLTGMYKKKEEFNEGWTPEIMVGTSRVESIPMVMEFFGTMCKLSLETDGMKTLMSYPDDTKFDLAITETTGGECFLGVLHKFGLPPVIGVSAFSSPQWIHDYVGNPHHPAYIPNLFVPYSHQMTFTQRLYNTLIDIYIEYLWNFHHLPKMNALSSQYFGPSAALPTEILQNISIVLASTHPAFDYPRPQVPSLISVAGIHIKDPEPLPNDLQNFLDEAKEGVLLFSLGSNLECDIMAEEKQQAFLEAFSQLRQKVLWKCAVESLPGQSTNVKLSKWLPQSDILAHPNVRLLITHAGLSSTQEAVYHGVPVVGIPFYADQYINIHKMVDHGVGVKLEYEDITKENVLKAISTVISDPRYSEKMHELSAKFRDQPETPLERAVFWCEYVLRHKGASHLRSAAVDLTWYQYLLLDVILLILVISCFIPATLVYWCCKLHFRKQALITKRKRS